MTDARLRGTVSLTGVVMDVLLRPSGLLDEREVTVVTLGTWAAVGVDDQPELGLLAFGAEMQGVLAGFDAVGGREDGLAFTTGNGTQHR